MRHLLKVPVSVRIRVTCGTSIFLVFFSLMQGAAEQKTIPPQHLISLDKVHDAFVGDWVGQLEYRDFSSDARVFLPTWLRVSQAADSRSLQFSYVYDDGPNKTVKEVSVMTIDTAGATASFTSDRDHSTETYKVAGLQDFADKGRGTLTLTGTGTENNKKVDVRITITVRRNLYTYQKETRLPGDEFQFRDAYTFTRKQAPE